MTAKDIFQARDPDLRASLQALQRAADEARKTAILTNTDLIVVQDGRIVRIPASQLREQMSSVTPSNP